MKKMYDAGHVYYCLIGSLCESLSCMQTSTTSSSPYHLQVSTLHSTIPHDWSLYILG